MKYKNKFFMLGLVLIVLLSISCVCAAENQTVLDDSSSESEDTVEEDTYDAELIADDFTAKYSPYNEYDVFLIDEDGEDIPDEDVRIVWGNGEQQKLDVWENEYYTWIDKNVGNYKATVVLKNSYYNAQPVKINVKITKATVKLTAKKWVSTTKQYSYLKVYVKDQNGDPVDEGKVKFTVNGKSYNVYVHEGVAVKKIKLSKAKTYTYKATFTGRNYNSKSVSSNVYVKKAKNYYVFKAYDYNKHPATAKLTYNLPYKYYVKLLNAKNNGKSCYFNFKSNVKVKGFKWFNTRCGFSLDKKGSLMFTYEVVYDYYPTFASKTYDLYKSI